jgi:hypothetical protein
MQESRLLKLKEGVAGTISQDHHHWVTSSDTASRNLGSSRRESSALVYDSSLKSYVPAANVKALHSWSIALSQTGAKPLIVRSALVHPLVLACASGSGLSLAR